MKFQSFLIDSVQRVQRCCRCSVVRNIALDSGPLPDIRQGMKMNKEKKVTSESQVSTLYSRPKIKDSLCELPARNPNTRYKLGSCHMPNKISMHYLKIK